MEPPAPLVLVGGLIAVVLGVPFGLYALLTHGQRRTTREIRNGARQRGWRYRVRHWQGNPTAFRIDGRTGSGLPWVLTSGGSSENTKGWTVRLALRFPTLGGPPDFAILPRENDPGSFAPLLTPLSAESQARVAAFSGTIAAALTFLREARAVPTGVTSFDARYQILMASPGASKPPVDAAIARQILDWPAEATPLHSMVAWRDPFGFHWQAHLTAPPNWAAVSYLLEAGVSCASRLPPGSGAVVPQGWMDRMIARFL